jgi:hypothetical protein
MNTSQLAAALHLKPQSIRKRYLETGGYYCLRPVKMPSRMLMWPADSIELLRGVKQ